MRAGASHGRASLQSSRMFVVMRTKLGRPRSGSMDARVSGQRSRAEVVKVVTSRRARTREPPIFANVRSEADEIGPSAMGQHGCTRTLRSEAERKLSKAGECARDMARSNNHKMGAVGKFCLGGGS